MNVETKMKNWDGEVRNKMSANSGGHNYICQNELNELYRKSIIKFQNENKLKYDTDWVKYRKRRKENGGEEYEIGMILSRKLYVLD